MRTCTLQTLQRAGGCAEERSLGIVRFADKDGDVKEGYVRCLNHKSRLVECPRLQQRDVRRPLARLHIKETTSTGERPCNAQHVVVLQFIVDAETGAEGSSLRHYSTQNLVYVSFWVAGPGFRQAIRHQAAYVFVVLD